MQVGRRHFFGRRKKDQEVDWAMLGDGRTCVVGRKAAQVKS